jgi:hypothetical protein
MRTTQDDLGAALHDPGGSGSSTTRTGSVRDTLGDVVLTRAGATGHYWRATERGVVGQLVRRLLRYGRGHDDSLLNPNTKHILKEPLVHRRATDWRKLLANTRQERVADVK